MAIKTNYEIRATKFAKVLANLFESCVYKRDYIEAIEIYNRSHSRKLKFADGVSRIAILRADYVIKFDFRPTGRWADGRAGDCEKEYDFYEFAVNEGMDYLLAKPTLLYLNGHTLEIMPRINGVHREDRYWGDSCTEEEEAWLWDNLYDLHEGNVGYKNGKVCVIDYAFYD